ncbi:tripartite tricarboxylate transporter permease [Haloferax sp. DFSO60]|uniref:tripartite tricarboxylate transporter permease n=1 Tax=Haloferax sp. DFSO60 TaxID=3388652 RepID=UPI00397BDB8E
MSVVGSVPAFAPVLAGVAVGIFLGTCSGLVPGLHANAFALLLASVAPEVQGPPSAVTAAMLAAATVHTCLDIVPSLALGVPDAALAPGALPGHRLVLGGRGREALRLSALGSGFALCLTIPIAIPLTAAMVRLYPMLSEWLWLVLLAVMVALVWTEPTVQAKLAGGVSIVAATTLGFVTLDYSFSGSLPVGDVLAPLLAGLFGIPVLLDAWESAGVPPQDDPTLATTRRSMAQSVLAGTSGGALVGYLPGVSAGVAGTFALSVLPTSDPETSARAYVTATSAATTATTVFALFALAGLGTPRTGVLVAISETNLPAELALAVPVTVCAGIVGVLLVPVLGDRVLELVGRVDQKHLVAGVCALLVALSWGFAGVGGVVILVGASIVGLLPPRLGCRRVHLMAVLLGPLVVR